MSLFYTYYTLEFVSLFRYNLGTTKEQNKRAAIAQR